MIYDCNLCLLFSLPSQVGNQRLGVVVDIIRTDSIKVVAKRKDPNVRNIWAEKILWPIDILCGPGFHWMATKSMNEHNTVQVVRGQ